jgi:hypothetical protein
MERAPSYDLVCIVADLLDMFNVESTKGQAREVSIPIRELADIVPVGLGRATVPRSFVTGGSRSSHSVS